MVAVADHLHFRRAAEVCAVSQPALSAQIRELEDQLGVTLFERTRRKVMLTPIGREVAARARAILRDADDMVLAARGAAEPLVGELWLGVIPTIAPYILPHILPLVRERYPRLKLLLREDRTAILVDALERGQVDIVFLALPITAADTHAEPLIDEPFLLAAPADHPLARKNRAVSQAALGSAEVLLLEEGHCLRDQALAVCQLAGARETEQVRATSMATLVQMVASGLGVTLVPRSAAGAVPEGVTVLPLRPTPTRKLGLVWRESSPRARDFALLAAVFRELLR